MFEKYINKGLTGLTNLGNTCFINTICQVLINTYELSELLDSDLKFNTTNPTDRVMITEWNELRKLMLSENCTVKPAKFINAVQKIATLKDVEQFMDFSQNDVTEFFLFLIECFHSAIKRDVKIVVKGSIKKKVDKLASLCFDLIKNTQSNDYSEIQDIFYGIHISQIKSLDGKQILSNKAEFFFIINLAIPLDSPIQTLKECLQLYLKGEVMDGENQWYNEETDTKMDVQKSILFWSLPTILVFDFKRYTPEKKRRTLISFPLNDLDLTEYVVGYEKETCIYELYAVCNHVGVVLGGHYTAYIKNPNGKWYEFNDNQVNEIHVDNVVSAKAYCLFYRKKDL